MGSPLGNAALRRVWIGATVSAAGDAASWVALVALVLGRAHGSVAVLVALYTAPVAIGGLVAGWALDRYDRRWLLAGDSLLRAVVFATVPLAAAVGGLSAMQLYLVAALYGLLKMISLAGFPALIPSLVSPGQLIAANAWSQRVSGSPAWSARWAPASRWRPLGPGTWWRSMR